MDFQSKEINLVPFLLKGDRLACSNICDRYLKSGKSIESLYENVLKKALYEIGLLWEQNKISVAKEHIATAIAEGILNEIYPQIITRKKNGYKIMLTTVENEPHQVGIKMVADVFEKNNWTTSFIGAGVPIIDLLDSISEFNPDVLAISLSVHFNYPNFLNMVSVIKKTYPTIRILAGGQAFTHINLDEKKIQSFRVFSNLNELTRFINQYKYE